MTIINIPTADEYSASGLSYLHMAWDIGIELHSDLENANYHDTLGEDITDEYWKLAQPALGNAFALLQQAQEFQLKSRIAAVSPFLLISNSPREWPAGSSTTDVEFSRFRTHDASDLIKIVNTVSANRIDLATTQFLDEVRVQRNTTVHFGVKGQRFNVGALFIAVLRTYQDLYAGLDWPGERMDHKSADHLAVAYTDDHVQEMLLNEFEEVISVLKPAEAKRFFGFDKRARRYCCPSCQRGIKGEYVALGQLDTKGPNCTTLRCFFCKTATNVLRKDCIHPDCKSNVISTDGQCLVCNLDQ